jgi:hypothetical protein
MQCTSAEQNDEGGKGKHGKDGDAGGKRKEPLLLEQSHRMKIGLRLLDAITAELTQQLPELWRWHSTVGAEAIEYAAEAWACVLRLVRTFAPRDALGDVSSLLGVSQDSAATQAAQGGGVADGAGGGDEEAMASAASPRSVRSTRGGGAGNGSRATAQAMLSQRERAAWRQQTERDASPLVVIGGSGSGSGSGSSGAIDGIQGILCRDDSPAFFAAISKRLQCYCLKVAEHATSRGTTLGLGNPFEGPSQGAIFKMFAAALSTNGLRLPVPATAAKMGAMETETTLVSDHCDSGRSSAGGDGFVPWGSASN